MSDNLHITVDQVNHPRHYTSDPSGVECIQITRHRNFNIGNAFKYLWRAGLKDEAKTIQEIYQIFNIHKFRPFFSLYFMKNFIIHKIENSI